MKFTSPISFDNQLKSGSMNHPARIYMLALPSPFERKRLVDRVSAYLNKQSAQNSRNCDVRKVDLSNRDAQEVIEALATQSLFGDTTVVLAENCDKLSAADQKKLKSYLASPSPSAFLVISSGSAKVLSNLYTSGKKESLFLDLTGEKPWEKQKRLSIWIGAKAKSAGKRISADTQQALLEGVGPDLAALDNEMNKLLLYVGNRPEITRSDLRQISAMHQESNGWEIGENIIWGNGKKISEFSGDLSALIALLGSLRYHLQMGLQITSHLEAKRSIPSTVKPFFVKKHAQEAKKRGCNYFIKGLKAIYETEMTAKSASIKPHILWIQLAGKLHTILEETHALSTPQHY